MSLKVLLSISSLLLFFPLALFSQGSLTVNQDERVDLLIYKHIQLNERMNGIPGYRIQVFFASGSDSKDRANAVKAEVLKRHTLDDVYILFEAPYYKVRVGDYRTFLDAEKALQEIRIMYPGAFIVEDVISLPRL